MFYKVANALHEVFGIQRPATEQHAVHLLRSQVAPEVTRLRAIADAAQQQLGATSAEEFNAAIAQLRSGR